METNDIKNIWKTLADNNLIGKELARENIRAIINNKGAGLISKMKKKVLFDFFLYLSAAIFIPLAILFVNIVLHRPSPILQIIGVFTIECYLLFMFLKSKRKLQSLDWPDNSGTIKDSLIQFRKKYLQTLSIEKWVVTTFAYFIVSLALVQYFIFKGSILPIDFSDQHSIFPTFLASMLFLLPLIIKLEYKIRFSQIIKDINKTIEELNQEV